MEYTIEGKASQTTSELLAAAGAEAAGLRAVWLGLPAARLVLPDDFDKAARDITVMNSIELYDHIKLEEMRGSGAVTEAKLEFYQRLLNPLAFLIMTFIGVAISSRKTRGGLGMHLAIGIALAFGFIVFMRVCNVFSVNGNLPPFLAVLLPQLVFGIAAAILIKLAPK
jgi:lipopolysaccharide export system permease protein